MNVAIPARHPEQPGAVPAMVRSLAQLLGIGKPTPEQWRRLGERLTVGDEPMDRLVDWMSVAGMEQTRPLFDRALAGGIDSVPEAPDPLREFFVQIETVPDWVDRKKLRRGARALQGWRRRDVRRA
jgi:hypothetical protein